MKHYHILKRIHKSLTTFMCANPECNWTRCKEFLIGKRFLCPYCSKPYIATISLLRLKTPHCPNCTKSPRVIISDPFVSRMVDGLVNIIPLSEVKE